MAIFLSSRVSFLYLTLKKKKNNSESNLLELMGFNRSNQELYIS